MLKRKLIVVLLFALCLMCLCSCGRQNSIKEPEDTRATIVCTTFPAYDAVRILTELVKPREESDTAFIATEEMHYSAVYCPLYKDDNGDVKLSEEDKGVLEHAAIVVHNDEPEVVSFLKDKEGILQLSLKEAIMTHGGSDIGMEDYYKNFASESDMDKSEMSAEQALLLDNNSYIWMPLESMAYIMQYIADKLIGVSMNGDYYTIAMHYLQELAKYDTEYELLHKISERNTVVVYGDCKFGNLLEYYNIHYAQAANEDELETLLKESADMCILVDSSTPKPKMANTQVFEINTMTEDVSVGEDTYLGIVKSNLDNLRKALN